MDTKPEVPGSSHVCEIMDALCWRVPSKDGTAVQCFQVHSSCLSSIGSWIQWNKEKNVDIWMKKMALMENGIFINCAVIITYIQFYYMYSIMKYDIHPFCVIHFITKFESRYNAEWIIQFSDEMRCQ